MYKKEVEKSLKLEIEIKKIRKENERRYGIKYCVDFDEEAKERWRLNLMASVLGLSKTEVKRIQADIKKLL